MARDKQLASAREATRYQREWFAGLHGAVAAGEPMALVNADAPQEIFRAMGIPYVVNQWWASVVAAKQRTGDYLRTLREEGYPDYSEQYTSTALASAFGEVRDPPWGGLPRPAIVLGDTTGDASRKVFDIWAEQDGVAYYPLESAAADTVPTNWWELMPDQWETAVGAPRLDLMVAELEGLVRFLEITTGRVFRESRFREVMALVNEQEEWNRRTRDLIARTRPVPLRVDDGISSVMIPQWHRGTVWARDAAKRFHDEVAERVSAGAAACPGERTRLMWIGRGLWYDMDFYRHFEETHGAVFVWSMYLAIAADGYVRYGDDPMRALAARFAAFSDQLYRPPWSTEWYLKEARLHQVDGVVHLVGDDARNGWFVTRTLEAAGIPVFEIHADNVDRRTYDLDAVRGDLESWLTTRVAPAAGRPG
ncbi:2-hydroxyacyl-CoA dehydratase family protein [Actinomadura sp. WMMB 499]|uniref:2-hydroxyacyl-CoA dehydratase family protein n=1 Tax=Actinomadura sp. WMMB 499 TaxID=1219491 RepID=UPI0012457FA0|nr:2-hydroxyacyl-CoA dehydratase family protein [Actinomadura sp. WMMB 499]QFG21003.1 2-hydroxyacyl-CoA dehydratase [Actinomadura sp. WMMB 499]